mgnify:CR=1 FL=1
MACGRFPTYRDERRDSRTIATGGRPVMTAGPRPPTGAREGVILVAAVLVLLALGLVALGLLFVSTQEFLIARSTQDVATVRTAAESAVRATVAGWSTGDYRDLAVGDYRPTAASYEPEGVRVATSVERLGGPLYLVRAEAERAPGPGAVAAAAMLVRALGIGELWEGFPAAVASRGPVDIATSALVHGTGAGMGGNCPIEATDTMRQIFGPGDRPAVLVGPSPLDLDHPVHGDVEGSGDPSPVDSARVGPLGWDDLRTLADRVQAGSAFAGAGARVDHDDTEAHARDWTYPNGAGPWDPGRHGAGSMALTYVGGDLRLTGGAAQGVLIVEGDLELSGEASFHGAIRVGGRLVVRDGAQIRGAVAVVGSEGAWIADEARVSYDVCALWSAFTMTPGLNRPLAPSGRRWVAVP